MVLPLVAMIGLAEATARPKRTPASDEVRTNMLLAFLMAMVVQNINPAAPTRELEIDQDVMHEEIIVVGRRLDAWRGQLAYERNRPRCRTTVSTGDRRIDRIGCDAMTNCAAQIIARDVSSRPEGTEMARLMAPCVREQRESLLRDYLATQRR